MISLGPFDVSHQIGQGGMCQVWSGLHRQQQRPVAVKVIKNEGSSTSNYQTAFRDEVRALAGLRHPFIIKVFDYGEMSKEVEALSEGTFRKGDPYLIMELAENSLQPFCGQLQWQQIYNILLSLLDALSHAHARGVLHRDIKPANVLVCDQGQRITLTDFGIAHALERESPTERAGVFSGTPAFMAPEQFMGNWRDYGPWTDLYALGCTAYTLLSGQPPYGFNRPIKKLVSDHFYKPIPALETSIDLPKGFSYWLQGLLMKDTTERFQCAADAAWALVELEAEFSQTSISTPPKTAKSILSTEKVIENQDSTALDNEEQESSIHYSSEWLEAISFLNPELSVLPRHQAADFVTQQESLPELATVRLSATPAKKKVKDDLPTRILSSEALPKGQGPFSSSQRSIKRFRQSAPPVPTSWRRSLQEEHSFLLEDAGLGLYGLRSIPLVARDKERDLLWRKLREVYKTRTPQVILLEGMAGCGKSSLAQWCCERAQEVGAATVCKAFHGETSSPMDGLGAMTARYLSCQSLKRSQLEERIRTLSQRCTGAQLEEWLSLVECIAPNSSLETSSHHSFQFEKVHERYASLARAFEWWTQERMLVLWLDDIQWGLDTLLFVRYLLEQYQHRPLPILILLTARAESWPTQKSEKALVDELLESPQVHHCPLEPLQPIEQTALIRELLGLQEDLALQVAERTSGNPLFAIQLVDDWVQRGLLESSSEGFRLREDAKQQLPDDIHQLWKSRIQRLQEEHSLEDVLCLEIAATLGQEVDQEEWLKACQQVALSPSSNLLESLLKYRLARFEDKLQTHWTFIHGMLCESLQRYAQEHDRAYRHHFACAQMLRGKKGSGIAERLARHLRLAGAYQEALPHYLEGLNERFSIGNFRLFENLFLEWEELTRELSLANNNRFFVEGELIRSRIEYSKGSTKSADQCIQKAILLARKNEWTDFLIRALQLQGGFAWSLGEGPRAQACFSEAERLSIQIDDTWLLAESRNCIGELQCFMGEIEGAKRHLGLAYQGFSSLGSYEQLARTCLGLSNAHRQDASQFSQATHYAQEAIGYFERSASRKGMADAYNLLGDLARNQGHFEQAEVYYNQCLQRLQALRSRDLHLCKVNLALLYLETQKYLEAKVLLEECIQFFEQKKRNTLAAVTHVFALTCLAGLKEWQNWEHHYQQAHFLLKQTQFYDVDIAKMAELAGLLSLKAEQIKQAKDAFVLSIEQWTTLENLEKADSLRQQLQAL